MPQSIFISIGIDIPKNPLWLPPAITSSQLSAANATFFDGEFHVQSGDELLVFWLLCASLKKVSDAD